MELAGLFKVEGGAARLIGSRCESCGDVAFPARQVCGECGGRDLLTKTLTGGGRVVSTTHVVTPPAGFDSPIDVAIVDLQEGPRVFALLTQPAHEGDSVQAVAAPVRGGNAGFAFEPRRKA